MTRNVYDTIEGAHGMRELSHVRTEKVFGIELTINSDIILKDGYTVIAGIEHTDGGNVVTVFDDTIKTDSAWYTMPAYCEHCGTRHAKKNTFIVRDSAGNYKQVGKSCLKDYCGIDPTIIAAGQEITDLILQDYDVDRFDFSGTGDYAFDVCDIIAAANDIINQYGYVKSGERMSTKDRLITAAHKMDPSKKSLQLAKEMTVFFAGLDYYDLTDYQRNVKSLLAAGYVRENSFGYLAYAPIAYKQMKEKQDRAAACAAAKEVSNYAGNVGEKLTFNVKETRLITSWSTAYGMTYLYRFITTDNNVLIWYASKSFDITPAKVTGTVKELKDYDGEKQTVITRCRVM